MNEQDQQSDQLGNVTVTTEQVHFDGSVIEKIATMTQAANAAQAVGGTFQLVAPEGYKVHDLTSAVEKALPNPRRKIGTVTLCDINSFVAYMTAHGVPEHTTIYADPETLTLTGIVNDHQEASSEGSVAGWRDFRAVYTASLSREFQIWKNNNKQPMEQEKFATFIEDNIADIVEPSGDTILQIALTLQAKTTANFSSSKRLDNGQVQLIYTEDMETRAGATGSIEIPREFAIGCRLFKNGDGYKIRARLKYRVGAGTVKFWYELDRHENALEEAFRAYVEKVTETGFAVLIGKA